MEKIDFNNKFNELLASFNRSMTKEFKEVWYNKLAGLKYEIFCKTVDSLVMECDKLPTMPQFFKEYYRLKGQLSGQSERGCLYCVNGFVLYERRGWGYKGPVSISEHCALCNPPQKGKGYNGKINRRGYTLLFTPGPVEEGGQDDRYNAMEAYRKVTALAADIGQTVPVNQTVKEMTEEEKSLERRARLKAMQDEEEAEKVNYPYKDCDEIPF